MTARSHAPACGSPLLDSHIETDVPAIAVAENSRALDPQLAHQFNRVLDHVVVVERTIDIVGGAPVAHLLHLVHTELRRKERDQR